MCVYKAVMTWKDSNKVTRCQLVAKQQDMHCLQHVWAPDDILICGVLQQVLIQLEGGHLICIQQVDVSVCLPVYTSELLGSSANKLDWADCAASPSTQV